MQLPLKTKQKFKFPYHLIDGERQLSVVLGVVSFSADIPLDTFFQYRLVFLKYNKALEIFSKVVLHHY